MGKAIGTWSYQRKGDSIEVELAPFESLAPEVLDTAKIKAKDLGRFLDKENYKNQSNVTK